MKITGENLHRLLNSQVYALAASLLRALDVIGYEVSLIDDKIHVDPKDGCLLGSSAALRAKHHVQEATPEAVLKTAPLVRTRGQALKDSGKKKVEANNRPWMNRMRAEAFKLAARNGSVAIDQLRWHADNTDDQPKHPGAWGAVFNEDRWVANGHKESEYADHRARIITVWSLQ